MSDTALTRETLEVKRRIKPEHLAWGIILAGFFTFCVVCTLGTFGLYFFFFQSSVPMETVLQAGHGTVGVREGTSPEEAESRARQIVRDTTIRTDSTNPLSQATLTLQDPASSENWIATVTLRGNTILNFERASRPRFEWSMPIYDVELQDLTGQIDVAVTQALDRDILIRIRTPLGAEIRLLDSGRYVVDASLDRVTVTNRDGEVIVIGRDRQMIRSVPRGWQGRVDATAAEVVELEPSLINLVQDSQRLQPFSVTAIDTLFDITREEVNQLPPGEWGCFVRANMPPLGDARYEEAPDGRSSLRLVRGDGANTNGEVRCVQKLVGDSVAGVDVTQYDYLAVQASVYIDEHTVARCGEQGSECPLMLQIGYFRSGLRWPVPWRHGVFALDNPAFSYPDSCDTCYRNHVQVYDGTWYTYNSGNLFDIIPPERRPEIVSDIAFYASGHEFDVYVDDVMLIVGNRSNATTPDE